MARSDYLFGYDPRKKDPWLDYVPNQITNRVSQQPQHKRSNWLARGNIRAAHAGRRASRLDEQQQMQQQMGQRQNALMESRMPLEERKFRQSQIEYGQGRQDKFGMQQAGFSNTKDVAQMGIDARESAAHIEAMRRYAAEDREEGRTIATEGRANRLYDTRRPQKVEDEKAIIDYESEKRSVTTGDLRVKRAGQLEPGSPEWQRTVGVTEPRSNSQMPPSSTERASITQNRASMDALNNLRSLVKAEFLGPIRSTYGNWAGKIGLTSQDEESFRAASAAFKNTIIQQITGAAMGKDEAIRILQQVPSPEDPPNRWQAKYEQSIKNIQFLMERQDEVLRQSNIIVPGETENPNASSGIQGMTDEQIIQAINQMRGQ